MRPDRDGGSCPTSMIVRVRPACYQDGHPSMHPQTITPCGNENGWCGGAATGRHTAVRPRLAHGRSAADRLAGRHELADHRRCPRGDASGRAQEVRQAHRPLGPRSPETSMSRFTRGEVYERFRTSPHHGSLLADRDDPNGQERDVHGGLLHAHVPPGGAAASRPSGCRSGRPGSGRLRGRARRCPGRGEGGARARQVPGAAPRGEARVRPTRSAAVDGPWPRCCRGRCRTGTLRPARNRAPGLLGRSWSVPRRPR